MYGLPIDFDGSFFIGRILEQVCFAAYTMYLNFDGEIIISIEGSFSYIKNRQQNIEVVKVPVSKSDVLELIGRTVKEVVGKRDGTLTLKFDNKHEFICYDNSLNYESYHIQNGNKRIVV